MNVQSAACQYAAMFRHHGPEDPRTIRAHLQLAEARAGIAEANAATLRALADAIARKLAAVTS